MPNEDECKGTNTHVEVMVSLWLKIGHSPLYLDDFPYRFIGGFNPFPVGQRLSSKIFAIASSFSL